MKLKVSQRAQILLVLVCEGTRRDDEGVLQRYWCPGSDGRNWSNLLKGVVYASGSGDAASLRALERVGLTKAESAARYSFSSTEAGVRYFQREICEPGKLEELRAVIAKHMAILNGTSVDDAPEE